MDPTYTREEINAAFARWLAEMQDDWPAASDPAALTETLCNYMEEARAASQDEPI